jgi:hypothetical protein
MKLTVLGNTDPYSALELNPNDYLIKRGKEVKGMIKIIEIGETYNLAEISIQT